MTGTRYTLEIGRTRVAAFTNLAEQPAIARYRALGKRVGYDSITVVRDGKKLDRNELKTFGFRED